MIEHQIISVIEYEIFLVDRKPTYLEPVNP